MYSIKKVMGLVSACLLAGSVLAGCGSKEVATGKVNQEDYVLKVAYAGGLCEAPIHMAIEKGFFDEEGLKYEAIKVESAQSVDALSTKQIDATFGLLAKMIQPLENGLEAKITSGVHTGCIKILVSPDSDIQSIKDLKGKKIGVPGMASSAAVVAQRSLANIGIGVTTENMEVEFIVYNQNDLPIALENGAIDAAAMSDPNAAIAVNDGLGRVILDSATDEYLKDEYCCVIFLRNEIVEKYPEVAAKYTRAIQKAAKYVSENPEETTRLQVEKKWVAGDPVVNAEILKAYNYIPSVSGAEKALLTNILDLQRIGLISEDTDAEALAAKSFIHLEGVPDTP